MKKKAMLLLLLMLIVFISACESSSSKEEDKTNDSKVEQTQQNQQSKQSKTLTEEEALKIVDNYVNSAAFPKNVHLDYDHLGNEDGKDYYVFHHYEVIIDDSQTGAGHTATYNWFYVDKATGDLFKLDVAKNKLVEIEPQNK